MEIKIQLLSKNSVIPSYSKEGDACMDLTAISINETNKHIEYDFGLALEIPEGYFGYIRPRSSISNTDLTFKTSGIIDSGYRGSLKARFQKNGNDIPKIGDRVAQLMILPYPPIEFKVVEKLSESQRGHNGHGSSGK